ncbi:MAG: hypothetical protein ACLGI9_21715, partial [Thermoanaerobaculia bacterium]
CASAPQPGTGDIAFRLFWQGAEDLDLHVQEPSEEHLSFLLRKSESGGWLDVDCNAAPDRICDSPVENVFWPEGKAPEGEFTYWIELFQIPDPPKDVPFTIQVLQGKTVVKTETGVVSPQARNSPRYRYRFSRALR